MQSSSLRVPSVTQNEQTENFHLVLIHNHNDRCHKTLALYNPSSCLAINLELNGSVTITFHGQ